MGMFENRYWHLYPDGRIFCSRHKIFFPNGENCQKCMNEDLPGYIKSRFVNNSKKNNTKKSHSNHGENHACGSSNIDPKYTSIQNGSPDWIGEAVKSIGDIRSHAFIFRISLSNPRNWADRKKILEQAGYKVSAKGGVVPVDILVFKEHQIWLSKNKITLYFPDWKQYWVDMARTGYNYAIYDFYKILHELERVLDSDFRIGSKYNFKVSRQHHAMVQSSLAKQYNREHKKLEVYNHKGELWLLIDNSDIYNIHMNDLETVHKKDAHKDMDEIVVPFFNQLKETKLMPNIILQSQAKTNDQINSLTKHIDSLHEILKKTLENEAYYAENRASHVGAIKDLGEGVKNLTYKFEEFSSIVEGLNNIIKIQFKNKKRGRKNNLSKYN